MKKIIGIISIVLFPIIAFQSCAAGIGDAMENTGGTSGSAGIILMVFLLIAGIITLISKESKSMVITAIVFYILGGILGFSGAGIFADLKIWSSISIIFGALLIYNLFKNKDVYNKQNKKL